MIRPVQNEDGLYQIFDGSVAYGMLYGSYEEALKYARSLSRSLAQLPDVEFEYDFYEEVLA